MVLFSCSTASIQVLHPAPQEEGIESDGVVKIWCSNWFGSCLPGLRTPCMSSLAGCVCYEQLWYIQGHVTSSEGCFWSASLSRTGLFADCLPLDVHREKIWKKPSRHWKQKLLSTEVSMFCGLFFFHSEYLQTGSQGHGAKIALSNSWMWNRDGLGMGQGEGANWEQLGQGTSPGDIYCWGELGLCLSPCIQGILQLPPAPWKLLPSGCFTLIQYSVAHDLWAVLSDLWSVWLAKKAGSGTWLLCKQGWHIISKEHRKDKITQIVEIVSSTVLLMWISKIRIRVVRVCVQVGFFNFVFLLHCLDQPSPHAGLFSVMCNSETGHQKFGCKTIPWLSTN